MLLSLDMVSHCHRHARSCSQFYLQYSIPKGGISAGRIFAYGVQFPSDMGTWEIVDDSTFDLSTTKPDNTFIYCLNADDKPHFLHAMIYSDEGFAPSAAAGSQNETSTAESTFDVSQTSLPESLTATGSLVLPFAPNYLYEGIREGDKVELIAAFLDPANFKGSNTPYDIITSGVASGVSGRVLASLLAAIVATVTMVL
jgi:hypothetical protein